MGEEGEWVEVPGLVDLPEVGDVVVPGSGGEGEADAEGAEVARPDGLVPEDGEADETASDDGEADQDPAAGLDVEEFAEMGEEEIAALSATSARMAIGNNFVIYLDDSGQIWGWGANALGQLGTGTTTSSTVPVRTNMSGALSGVTVVALAAGQSHSMALGSNGRVYAWGYNDYGAVGDNTRVNRPNPVMVGGALANLEVVQIAAGGGPGGTIALTDRGRSFAVTSQGRVYGWGGGSQGAVGNGTNSTRIPLPALVGGVLANQRVIDISVGTRHTVVATESGALFSWGRRVDGSFGDGATGASTFNAPRAVTMTGALSGARIVQVAAGEDFTMALADDGRVFTWGVNNDGQLGVGSTAARTPNPAQVGAAALNAIVGRPVQISSGSAHAAVLGDNGRVASWGRNARGQLGNNSTATLFRAPVAVHVEGVLAGVHIQSINAGAQRTHAIGTDGRVYGWGANASGQMGIGTTVNAHEPVNAAGLQVSSHPADVAVGLDEVGSFSAATVGLPATVQWETSTDGGESWAEIEGATSTTYSTPPATDEMHGSLFRAVFTNSMEFPTGVIRQETSNAAMLSVTEVPVITLHPPERVRSVIGLDVSLEAAAGGSQPMTVQWQQSTDEGATWVDIDGATEATHVFTATEDHRGMQVRAVFTNPWGFAETTATTLEVFVGAPQAYLRVTPTARYVDTLTPVLAG